MNKEGENIAVQVEELAEAVLIGQQQLIDYDRKRNSNREALNALKKVAPDQKVWTCFGDMFIKFPQPATKKILDENQKRIETEITKLRQDIKEKAQLLNDMEGRDEEKREWEALSRLRSLSKQDMNMLSSK
eukprot:TRINITY_DN6327_c0_g1_i1.p1 TRINITY_DN6327_c0_g1~~TRINITY_DN6327_c0_g1_i1.p1  ORF type:complete len:131 (+),score=35.60 TRINITY_DN6327_c0_g1_i1:80-472(+)